MRAKGPINVAASRSISANSSMLNKAAPAASAATALTAPADLLRCADGEIIVSAYLEPHWRSFAQTIGAPELLADPRFTTGIDRARGRAELVAAMWIAAGNWSLDENGSFTSSFG